MYEEVGCSERGERGAYVEIVAFGAQFFLTTPLGIKRFI